MPISYSVLREGHFIHSIAEDKVSFDEFLQFEINHTIDERVKTPAYELFEIKPGAFDEITKTDIKKILEERKRMEIHPKTHKCAVVVSPGDIKSWDVAKFYEDMSLLHHPEVVIVFGDINTAKIWLRIK